MSSSNAPYSIKETIYDFLRAHPKEVGVVLVLALSAPIAGVLLPRQYGKLVDILSKTGTAARAWASPAARATAGLIIGLWLVLQLMYAARDHVDRVLIPKLLEYVRKRLVLDVIETYKNSHEELELGDIVAKLVKLPLIVQNVAHQVRSFFLPAIFIGLAVGLYLFWVHPLLGVVFCANVVALLGVVFSFSASCKQQSGRMQAEDNMLNEEISDVLNNLLNVYVGDGLAVELERLEKQHYALSTEFAEMIRCSSRFKVVYNVVTFTTFLSVNAVSFFLYSKKRIGLDHVVAILMAMLFFTDRLSSASAEIRDFVFDLGVLANVQDYLNMLKTRAPPPGPAPEPFTFTRGAVAFDDVAVARRGRPVFEHVNLALPPGRKVALVGRNGAGKSTLTKVLLRLVPYTGTVAIDGRDIRTIDTSDLRKQIIYIPQTPRLFNRSVYDNITYGIKGASEALVREKLAKYGLTDLLGHKLGAPVGKNGENLSGGQQQIVYLLRCVLRGEGSSSPPIVVMDEPTAALDRANKARLFAVLETIMADKTVLFVTHDDYLLGLADLVVDVEQLGAPRTNTKGVGEPPPFPSHAPRQKRGATFSRGLATDANSQGPERAMQS